MSPNDDGAMPSKPRIAVLGSLHMDIVVRAGRQPRLGETLAGESWRRVPGGKGLNQAAHAARHGAAVHMFGRVGGDEFAQPLLDHLARHGVDVGGVGTCQDAGTGMSVAVIEATGDYAAVIVSGANQRVDADDVAAMAASRPAVLLLQNEVAADMLAPAARAAKRAGARVVWNAAPAAPPPEGILEAVDLLVVNQGEAEALTATTIADTADALGAAAHLVAMVPTAILTLGNRGLLVAERGGPAVHLPAYKVAVADTHGAGDALIGALGSRIAEGASLIEAARYANAAAALMVAAVGSDPVAISPAQVCAMLAPAAGSH